MNNDRDEAKANATDVDTPQTVTVPEIHASSSETLREPRLQDAQLSAEALKSQLQNQKHLQAMKTREVGWFGVVFGTESLASIVIAFAVIVLSFVTAAAMEYAGWKSGNTTFWSHEAQQIFAIITAALGFIFGRSNRDPGK